jgi:hypothetical protein
LAAVATLAVALVVTAPPASAHGAPGVDDSAAENYRYRIDDFDPGVEGIELSCIQQTDELELVNTSTEDVVVLGYAGEPYLRVGPDGVFTNSRSPATYLNTTRFGDEPVPEVADADAAPEWQRTSTGTTARWHDHRAHWMAPTPAVARDDPGSEHELATWTVAFEVDGRRVDATGTTSWIPPPSPVPWLLLAAALAVAVAVLARWRHWRIAVAVAAVLLLAACAVDVVGTWWASPSTTGERLSALTVPGIAALFVVVGLAQLRRRPLDGAALVAGGAIGLAILFGWMSRAYLSSSQLPVELPRPLSRATVSVALGLGVGLLVLAVVRWTARDDVAPDPAS